MFDDVYKFGQGVTGPVTSTWLRAAPRRQLHSLRVVLQPTKPSLLGPVELAFIHRHPPGIKVVYEWSHAQAQSLIWLH